MLTRRQHECLTFLCERAEKSAVSPSYREIMSALGLKSQSNVHPLLSALAERGFVHWHKGRARSITILRTADGQDLQRLKIENARLRAELAAAKEQIVRLHQQAAAYRAQVARA